MSDVSYDYLITYMVEHIYEKTYIYAMNITADDYFAAVANPVRLRCLFLLLQEQELCVCELMYALDMSQPMISRHLAQLRKTGLVMDRREGQWIYYRLNHDLPAWVRENLQVAADGIKTEKPYVDDLATLSNMPNRPSAPCCA